MPKHPKKTREVSAAGKSAKLKPPLKREKPGPFVFLSPSFDLAQANATARAAADRKAKRETIRAKSKAKGKR